MLIFIEIFNITDDIGVFAVFQYIFLCLKQLPKFGCLFKSDLWCDFDCIFLCCVQIVSQVDITPVTLSDHLDELDIMLLVYFAWEIDLSFYHIVNIKYK